MLCVLVTRKFSSIRDFKCIAMAEIVQNSQNGAHPKFRLSFQFYDWIGTKMYLYRCSALDRRTASVHFPNLEKYIRWTGKPIECLVGVARADFFEDMEELFGASFPAPD